MKRLLSILLGCLLSTISYGQSDVGDYFKGDTVRCMWNSFDSAGASITRSTDGTVQIYEDGSVTQITAGITDTEDFDGLTGVHYVEVDTSNAAYEAGKDYLVAVSAATIDSSTVNAALCSFSLERNVLWSVMLEDTLAAADATTITLSAAGSANNGEYDGMFICPMEGTGLGQNCVLAATPPDGTTYNGTTKVVTLANSFVTTLAASTVIRIIRSYSPTIAFPTNFGDTEIEAGTGYVSGDMKEIETVDATDQVRDSVPAANEIRDAIADKVLETGITWECALALITAYTNGPWVNSGIGDLTTTYKEPNNVATRSVVTRTANSSSKSISSFTCP